MTNKYLQIFWTVLLFFAVHFSATAQQVRFNEIVSSNSVHFDAEGDSPDWFELHNFGETEVSLEGWAVSDQKDKVDKWTLPNLTLEADDYLNIWASGKDRPFLGIPRTLVTQGDVFRYLIPQQFVSNQWTKVGFVDLTWQQGESGFGYGDGDDTTFIPQGTGSIFIRKSFSIKDPESIEELFLDIDYDDGFVAYLNGTEVARANIEGIPPAYYAYAIQEHEAVLYQNRSPERFYIENPKALLQSGTNVLAIQAHNISNTSSDFSIIPFLTAIYNAPTDEGTTPPSFLSINERALHTNFKISSKGETLYLFNAEKTLVDSIFVENLLADVSYGIPSEGNEYRFFDTTTPGNSNPSHGFRGISQPNIVFSNQGGAVESFSLELSGVESPATIRYTLDSTIPNENSNIYNNSLPINDTQVVRARVFQEGYIPSRTQSRTYIVNASHELPVVTLVTEPDNFFDNEYGMYVLGDEYQSNFPYFGANFWSDWERPIHFALYEKDGSLGTALDAGTKIFGGWSRAHAQRSLSIFARNRYGFDEINYPLFPNRDYDSFQAIVLRNSGNDWINTMMRDGTLTSLMEGSGLDFQAYRPVVTYLNGQYWGFYNMREKINEHFLATKHNLNPEDIDLLEFFGIPIQGDSQDYLELTNFVSNNSLVPTENYQFVTNRIDIQNFIQYYTAQIYFNNTDWPGNNIKFWRPKNGKWRWILFDTDFGFGTWNDQDYLINTLDHALETNGPNWPNPPWSTLLFRKLVQNTTFKNAFVNHFADELNSRFLSDAVVEHIDQVADAIAFEVNSHYERWGESVFYWFQQVGGMKTFAENRPLQVKQHILQTFNLDNYHPLTLLNDAPEKGSIQVNSLTINENQWIGDYFEGVPVKLKALPKEGYQFAYWSGANVPNDAEIEVNVITAISLKAHFEASEEKAIVINEINYNSSDEHDTDDWIELYNPNEAAVNLSNWIFKDNDDAHSFVLPEGTSISGKGYLILTRNGEDFAAIYPEISNFVGDFDFGLSSNGDAVRLFNDQEILQDEVQYLPDAPWPTNANGEGATLELISPELDNSLAENWANVHEFGSPAKTNLFEDNILDFHQIQNLQYFPNPFTEQIHVHMEVNAPAQISAQLFDRNGALVHTLFEGKLTAGEHELEANLDFLSSGIYILQLKENERVVAYSKWVKL